MVKRPIALGPVRPKRWSRTEYHTLGELGVLDPEVRVELVEGEILELTPQGSKHVSAIMRTANALTRLIPGGFIVRTQFPLTLGEYSEPEPDIAVVQGSINDYTDHHPESARLVVEVSDTTLTYDLERKGPLYAEAGIPEYWIINLQDSQVEIYQDPGRIGESLTGYGYRSRRLATRGDVVRVPETDTSINVDDLLP